MPAPPTATVTTAYNPLAIPTLPKNPSQADLGKYSYYFNCMPCHGDIGQGLTDEWRQVWEEDHQNCWERGCHGSHGENEGFPIPTVVPAVISHSDALSRFRTPDDLFNYLKTTHPPQHPGRLEDKDYHALVAYLWVVNQKSTPLTTATPTPARQITPSSTPSSIPLLPCGTAGMLIAGMLRYVIFSRKQN